MRPKRQPYSGKKKQPHGEIAELKKQIAVNKSMINHLEREIKKQQCISHQNQQRYNQLILGQKKPLKNQ